LAKKNFRGVNASGLSYRDRAQRITFSIDAERAIVTAYVANSHAGARSSASIDVDRVDHHVGILH
jgi:hypothetical protein